MATIQFTRNHEDHSNDQGYQFEFMCDKCGNGFRSSFVASKLGMASSVLGAAADMFGGVFGHAASAGDRMKDALRGKAHDDAFGAAVAECKPKFRQCRRCGKWVCPEVCWNEPAAQCKECAPALEEESASAQAHALKQAVAAQYQEKAAAADLAGKADVRQQKAGACPHCNAPATGAKFCGECGKPMSVKTACAKCKAEISGSPKFCPECGAPRQG